MRLLLPHFGQLPFHSGDRHMKNIVLIGMMGCGKSTCGRLLAERLDRELVDTDAFIEARQGRSIPDIFAQEGEAHFRALEREAAQDLAQRKGLVIACGGGLPIQEAAMEPLARSGLVIFLGRDPADIFAHVSMVGRPLGRDGEAAFLERYAAREPIYRRRAYRAVPVQATPQETVDLILEGLEP